MDTPNEPSLPVGDPSHPKPEQRQLLWAAITALSILALFGVAAFMFWGFIAFLSWCYPILLPIGLAVIIALVLDPFVNFIQKRGLGRGNATLVVCLLTVVGFLLFWAFLLPPLVTQTGSFFKSLPATLNDGLTKLQAAMAGPKQDEEFPGNLSPTLPPSAGTNAPSGLTFSNESTTNAASSPGFSFLRDHKPGNANAEIQAWLASNMPAIQATVQKNLANLFYQALGPVGQAFGFILGFGFVPIYVYYFLADQDRLSKHWHDYVPIRRSHLRDEVVSVLNEINQVLVNYFRGQIIVAACNGVLTIIGLSIIGIPYSLVLGVITGALSIIPFLGIIASIIPALLLGFLSAKGDPTWQWLTPLLVVGVFAIVQASESMFITPRVQSHSTGLHPLAIILGILFWSLLLPGLLGSIVAVPLTCAVVVILRRYVWQDKTAG
jgi:predicted PurR-regulated permease PerM